MSRIKSIKRKKISHETLHNLAVEGDESYIANGVVVHNCRSVIVPITRFETLTPDTRVGGTVKTRRGKDIKVPNREIESFIEEFKGKGFSKQ